jgi:hypothetical protein
MWVSRSPVTGRLLLSSMLLPATVQAQSAGSRTARETIRLDLKTNMTMAEDVRFEAIGASSSRRRRYAPKR